MSDQIQCLTEKLCLDLAETTWHYAHSHTPQTVFNCHHCLEYSFFDDLNTSCHAKTKCWRCGECYDGSESTADRIIYSAYCHSCKKSVWVNGWSEDRFTAEVIGLSDEQPAVIYELLD